jgi:hypothetical protein
LPPIAVAVPRAQCRQQLELRMALGLGKPEPDALVFSNRMDRLCHRTTFRGIGGGHAGRSACRW